ncbi:hypothetical protein [uncultured Shewanella sp.]|uniref:hypothetical protein n=1 Tax=uncultured Shewanella sp. TaxID=173975 RepID=UPI002619993F|nr:hypothetical protein [uncultured Shewanella sp.]
MSQPIQTPPEQTPASSPTNDVTALDCFNFLGQLIAMMGIVIALFMFFELGWAEVPNEYLSELGIIKKEFNPIMAAYSAGILLISLCWWAFVHVIVAMARRLNVV